MKSPLAPVFMSIVAAAAVLACKPSAEANAAPPPPAPHGQEPPNTWTPMTGVFPSAEGTLIICNQQDHNVYLASLKDGKIVKKVAVGTGPHEAAVSPSGKLVAVTNYGNQQPGNSLSIIELPSGNVVKTVSLGEYTRPHGVDWVDEDRAVVTSETTKNLVLVNVTKGAVERAMPTDAQGSHMLALAKDRKKIYSGNVGSNNVTAIDFETGKEIGKAPSEAQSEGIGVSPDGKWVWTGNRGGNSVSIIDTALMKNVKNIPTPGGPYRVQFSVDGKKVLVPCPQIGALAVFDAEKQELIKNVVMNSGAEKFKRADGNENPGPVGVTVHPNGKYAYCAVHWSFSVAVIDLEKLQVVGKIEAGKSPDGVAVSRITVTG